MNDTDGRNRASATKFVSPLTYLISVVSSAIKANCFVCRSDGRSVTDVITKVKGLWSVFTKKLLSMYCCKTTPTAKSLASHAIFNGAEWSGCTKRVALASICLDSMNTKYVLSFHFKSKKDLGDNLVCPSLAAVSKLFNGLNLAAQCGMNLW